MDKSLADHLGQLRHDRGWSLDQLAEETGISRASLARIEKAQVSPTTETLAKLCRAYALSMSRLLAMVEDQTPAVIPASARTRWTDPLTGYSRTVLSPSGPDLAGEWLDCALPAGQTIHYDAPPKPGLEHHLLMQSGTLTVEVDGIRHALTAGDCLRYRLYGASSFSTESGPESEAARYYLILI